jgi:cytoskeletal protein CcmA (bactofilin family)
MKTTPTTTEIEKSADSRIAKGVEVSGELSFKGSLDVAGKLKGTVVAHDGALKIETGGEVDAQVDVGVCIIRGAFKGNVKAKSRVEVYKTAKVNGEIATPVLLVEEGAECNAAIMMAEQAKAKGQA